MLDVVPRRRVEPRGKRAHAANIVENRHFEPLIPAQLMAGGVAEIEAFERGRAGGDERVGIDFAVAFAVRGNQQQRHQAQHAAQIFKTR